MNWYKIIKNKMFIRMSKTISNKEAKDILNGSITHPNAKIARLMAKQSANALDSIALQIAQLLIEAYSGINQASLSKVRNIVSFISDGLSVEQAIEMGTALALKSTGAETLNEGQQQLIQLLYGAFFERNGQKKIQEQSKVQNEDPLSPIGEENVPQNNTAQQSQENISTELPKT